MDATRLHYDKILEALAQDRLQLPSLPDVALKIGNLAHREEATAAGVAELIARDPAISVRVLRAANSAASSAGRKIESLNQAVARLGLETTRLLVSGFAMEQIFQARDPGLRARLRQVWSRSVEIAALSRMLALHSIRLNPELAMLAGLVQGIGVLPVLAYAEQTPALRDTPELLDCLIDTLHPKLGTQVLAAWQFPAALCAVPEQCRDLARQHPGPADYADVVTVARLHAQGGAATPANISAFDKLGLHPEVQVLELDGYAESYNDSMALMAA